MRTAVPVAAVLLVAALVALLVVSGQEDDAYRVRAIFDNAGFVIPGEDVKVAGVKVGQVDDVEVTPDFKAAVVLRIDDPGYQDFRTDASCIARPQSLIGEKFVECKPTQTRGAGQEAPGELRVIADATCRRSRASGCMIVSPSTASCSSSSFCFASRRSTSSTDWSAGSARRITSLRSAPRPASPTPSSLRMIDRRAR